MGRHALDWSRDFPVDRLLRLAAFGVYSGNICYLRAVESANALQAAIDPWGNVVNLPQINRVHRGDQFGAAGVALQWGMFFVSGVALKDAVKVLVSRKNAQEAGRATIKTHQPVIVMSCGGMPMTASLARSLGGHRTANLVLYKVDEHPARTPREREAFGPWYGVRGGVDRQYFDTESLERAGARRATAVVLNSSSTRASIEAARVIRDGLDNANARIVFVSSDPDELSKPADELQRDRDELSELNVDIVDPYLEVAKETERAILNADVSPFIVDPGKKASNTAKRSVEDKRQRLSAILTVLQGRTAEPICIFLDGKETGVERTGLLRAFNSLSSNRVIVTDELAKADAVLVFGDGVVTNDKSVLGRKSRAGYRDDDVIQLRVLFDRDNELNALAGRGADAVLSFENVTVRVVAALVQPFVRLLPRILPVATARDGPPSSISLN